MEAASEGRHARRHGGRKEPENPKQNKAVRDERHRERQRQSWTARHRMRRRNKRKESRGGEHPLGTLETLAKRLPDCGRTSPHQGRPESENEEYTEV